MTVTHNFGDNHVAESNPINAICSQSRDERHSLTCETLIESTALIHRLQFFDTFEQHFIK